MLSLCSSKALAFHGCSVGSLTVGQKVCELLQQIIMVAEEVGNLHPPAMGSARFPQPCWWIARYVIYSSPPLVHW